MNVDPKDDLDRAIDEALASMVQGEPRRVSGASVRQAVGEGRRSNLPVWLALAAVLIVGLAVALTARAPLEESPAGVAQSVRPPGPIEVRSAPSLDAAGGTILASGRAATPDRLTVATTTEPAYEGLPRLTIASIDLPEPLSTSGLAADPIRIPTIDIPPLSVATLSTEPENKQEPLQ